MYLEEIKVRKEKITSGTNRSPDCGIFWCSPCNCVHPTMTQTPRTVIKEATNL